MLLVPACPLKLSGRCRIKVNLSISCLSSRPLVEVTVMNWEAAEKESLTSLRGQWWW